VLVDQGDRSHGPVGGAAVMIPGKKGPPSADALRRYQTLCKRRSAIEAITEWVATMSRSVQETRIIPYWKIGGLT
jgi:hypothetical protein